MNRLDRSVILIVDDKPANLVVLENLLNENDRVLLTAQNGKEALHIALNQHLDLVILDVQMPDMDGFEVAQILKSNKRTKNIPIIFATAENKERTFMMKGYDEGGVDYFFKPLDPDIVRARVTVLLKLQMQQKELIVKNNSLQRSALLINNSADIIGIVDGTTLEIEEMNKAFTRILGYPGEEVSGKKLETFVTAEETHLLHEHIRSDKDNLSFETWVKCKDGTIKWLQWNVVVYDGKWFVNARDVTGIKIADEQIRLLNADLQSNVQQLELINKELESFSYSVSHDLRAPLRALSGYSQMLEEDYGATLDEEARRLLRNIKANALRMGTLIDDLLAFSRLGRKEIQRSQVDVEKMVRNVVMETVKQNGHHAKVTTKPLLPAAADYTLLQQVWVNLISNAVKYSSKKPNPEIEIGANDSGDEITYYVKDNGSGFDMKYADKLFGVFQRLHSPSEFEGTGVGLAIVQRIITKHGGRVWAEAKRNEGATFYFTIPKTQIPGQV
jgi:PAS domain S-box-containing protein